MFKSILGTFVRSDDFYMPLIAFCIYLYTKKSTSSKEKMLGIFLIINIFFGAVTDVMGYFHRNNLALYHFYTLFEQWFLSIYLCAKIDSKKITKNVFVINVVFTIFWIINILLWEKLDMFNTNTSVVSNFILLWLCMYYLFQMSKKDEILHFQKFPSFWIVSGFLVYSALSILFFSVYKYYALHNLTEEGSKIYGLMYVTEPAKYIMISIGLLCYKKPTLSTPKLS